MQQNLQDKIISMPDDCLLIKWSSVTRTSWNLIGPLSKFKPTYQIKECMVSKKIWFYYRTDSLLGQVLVSLWVILFIVCLHCFPSLSWARWSVGVCLWLVYFSGLDLREEVDGRLTGPWDNLRWVHLDCLHCF